MKQSKQGCCNAQEVLVPGRLESTSDLPVLAEYFFPHYERLSLTDREVVSVGVSVGAYVATAGKPRHDYVVCPD